MKRIHVLSWGIMAIITFIILGLLFKNEDKSILKVNFMISSIVFLLGIPSSFVSKKIISYGGGI